MKREEIRIAIRNYNCILDSELDWRDHIISQAVARKWSARYICDELHAAKQRIRETKNTIAKHYQLLALNGEAR